MEYYEFAGRLKALKIESGAPKTQEKFAEWLGVSKSIVSEWLRGEKIPSMDTAIKLADKFDVSVDWLIRGRGTKHVVDNLGMQSYINVTKLTGDQRAAVALMIDVFLKSNPENKIENAPPTPENKPLTNQAPNAGGGGLIPATSRNENNNGKQATGGT